MCSLWCIVHAHGCFHPPTWAHTHTRTHMRMHKTHTHSCTHTHAHAHTHTYTHIRTTTNPSLPIAPKLSNCNTHGDCCQRPSGRKLLLRLRSVLQKFTINQDYCMGWWQLCKRKRDCFRQHLLLLFNVTLFIPVYFSGPTAR